jgi:Holliday junction resolvasome RuvABC ATP-dependent DNA helicase subunit
MIGLFSVNPQDLAKDAIRIATIAGLRKDVIERLNKKVVLLTEKITALKSEKSILDTENAKLKKKLENFHRQLADLSQQTSGLDEISHKILASLFYNGEFSVESLAQTAGILEGLAKYYLDDLKKEGLIQRTLRGGVSFEGLSVATTYDLTPRGREYVVKDLRKK